MTNAPSHCKNHPDRGYQLHLQIEVANCNVLPEDG